MDTFEGRKLELNLKRFGKPYTFYRKGTNEFGEPDDEPQEVKSILGIVHEVKPHILSYLTEASDQKKPKPQTYLLTQWSESNDLKKNDWVVIGNLKYYVQDVDDKGKLGIYGDISLREEE